MQAEIISIPIELDLKCSRCKSVKNCSEFYKRHTIERGYDYACKECLRKKFIAYRKDTPPDPNEKFTCKKCEETKFSSEFHLNKFKKFGIERQCKECQSGFRKAARDRFWKKNGGRDGYKTDTWGFKKHYYGITKEQFFQILASQGGACAVCRTIPNGEVSRVFHVDHNHKTEKIRGLLCANCNHGLGKFMDNPSILRNALSYLEERGSYGS